MPRLPPPDNLANLAKGPTPSLKDADFHPDYVAQYIANATAALHDAQIEGLSAHGRFIVAYEGLFAIAMSTLNIYGYRPGDAGGHRSTSLQAAITVLGLQQANADAVAQVIRVHDMRNNRLYRAPIPPIGGKDADLAAGLLKEALGAVHQLAARTATPAAEKSTKRPKPG